LLERYPEIAPTLAQVERDPSDLGAKRRLADFYSAKKLYRRALQTYAELAVAYPEDSEIQLILGQIWDYQGAYSIALRHALDAVELDPDSTPAMTLLGMVYLHRDEPKKASQALLSALSKNPKDANVLANTGFAFLQLKDWEKAVNYLQASLDLDPESDTVHNNLGIAKAYMGDRAGAIKEFLAVSEPAVAYNNLGAAYLSHELWSEARDAFEISLRWDPSYVKARLNLMEAESYLPPPNIVDIDHFDTRLAWVKKSWQEHEGISNLSSFNLPKQRLFNSSQSLPFPLQRLGNPVQPASSSTSGQELFSRSSEGQLVFQPGAIKPEIAVPLSSSSNAESAGLAELEPLPFTVVESSASTSNSQQADQEIAALIPGSEMDLAKTALASPAEMTNLSNLLAQAVSAPVASPGQIPPPPASVKLAGGSLLNMLVNQPSLDWNAGAGVTKDDQYHENVVTMTANVQPGAFPAQVWLMPSPAAEKPAATETLEPAPAAQMVRDMAAMQRIALPFQIFGTRSQPDIDSISLSGSRESAQISEPAAQQKKTAEVERKVMDTGKQSEKAVSVTSQAATHSAAPELPNPEGIPEYPALSFDQFSAVREQVLEAQLHQVGKLGTDQAADTTFGFSIRSSGLAGIAGAALILFALGTTQLYMRWRSPLKRRDTQDQDAE